MNERKKRAAHRLLPASILALGLMVPAASLQASDLEITSLKSTVDPMEIQFEIEGLPPDAPREGKLITVDTTKNVVYFFENGELVASDKAATGMDKVMKKGKRTFVFRTPRGLMKVLRKIKDPIWTKPDWAFIEKGQKPPAWNSPKRKEKGVLGKYALDLGDGILIHGTRELNSLGKKASHGCIRLGPELLETLYTEVEVGTPVYVF